MPCFLQSLCRLESAEDLSQQLQRIADAFHAENGVGILEGEPARRAGLVQGFQQCAAEETLLVRAGQAAPEAAPVEAHVRRLAGKFRHSRQGGLAGTFLEFFRRMNNQRLRDRHDSPERIEQARLFRHYFRQALKQFHGQRA